MHRFARLAENQDAKLESEAPVEPKTKKNGKANRVLKIATLDNGTMVEAFKYLNYCQLAKNSLVSKRFLDVIQTHRHKLALLYVESIYMNTYSIDFSVIKVFDKQLSPESYNKWVIRNNYSKQVPLEAQVASTENTENISNGYQLVAHAKYKEPYHCEWRGKFTALSACVKLSDETWPLFEHFVQLLMDPFVRIWSIGLIPQKEIFSLLAATIDRSNRDHLQCELLQFNFERNSLKIFHWIKDHVRCFNFRLTVFNRGANQGKHLLDFLATGSHCASEIVFERSHRLKAVIVGLVQKFVNLKNCTECQIVHSIQGDVVKSTAEGLKSNYAKFFIKKEVKEYGWTIATVNVFEFVNADIGKKMQLTVSDSASHQVTLKIINFQEIDFSSYPEQCQNSRRQYNLSRWKLRERCRYGHRDERRQIARGIDAEQIRKRRRSWKNGESSERSPSSATNSDEAPSKLKQEIENVEVSMPMANDNQAILRESTRISKKRNLEVNTQP